MSERAWGPSADIQFRDKSCLRYQKWNELEQKK